MSFEVSNITPTSISSITEEVKVDLVSIDMPVGSYLRVSFQKNDGDIYFGEMSEDRNSWISIRSTSSGDCSGYYLTSSGTTTVSLYLRIGSNNPVAGDYKVKVNRFTAGCNLDTNTKMEGMVTISLPTPTPISTPSPTATPSPSPTVTPTPTPTVTSPPAGGPTPTPIKTLTPTVKPVLKTTVSPSESQVLAARKELEVSSSPTSTPNSKTDNGRKLPFGAVAAMIAGVGFIGVASFPFIRMRLKGYNEKHASGKSEEMGQLH